MGATTLSKLNQDGKCARPLEQDAPHRLATQDDLQFFEKEEYYKAALLMLDAMFSLTPSRDKYELALIQTIRRCRDCGMEEDLIEEAMRALIDRYEFRRGQNPIASMF